MKKKWLIIIISAFIGIFVLIWIVGVKNASNFNFGSNTNTSSIAKAIKTTPDAEWILDPEIDANYIPVPGEQDLFMVLNEDGTIKEYRKRTKGEDGTWYWETVDNNTDIEIAKVTDTDYGTVFKLSGPSISINQDLPDVNTDEYPDVYKRYVIDDNGGYAWVDTDATGLPLSLPTGSTIPDNYIPLNDNTYAVYNDYGVLESYLKRIQDEYGGYQWSLVGKPEMLAYASFDRENETYPINQDDIASAINNNFQFGEMEFDNEVWSPAGDTKTITYTYPEQKEVDGFVIYYKVVITRTEDKDGNLLSTKREDIEIGRSPKAEVNNNSDNIALSLGTEAQRISNNVLFDTETEAQLLNFINELRTKENKVAFNSFSQNDNMRYLAFIKAADMANTGITTKNSANYGTIEQLASKYNVSGNFIEGVLETPPTGGDVENSIHQRFLIDQEIKNAMLNSKDVMIKVAQNNGKYYVYYLFEV